MTLRLVQERQVPELAQARVLVLVQVRPVQEQAPVLVQQQVLALVVELAQEPELQQVLVLVLNPRLPRLQSQFLLQPCHLLAHESLSTHLQ
jgi:hypothetical protein